MSYSETITRTDLMNILNQILPQASYIQSWEYVGDCGSNVFNNSWTATDDGVAIVKANWNTSGNFAYWYVSDQTDGRQVANLGGTANGTTLTTMIPIIKGHTYQSPAKNAVSGAYFYFYKFTLKETIPEPAVDYIVEQGTATPDSYGTWTYRKWNSGVAECWRDLSVTSFAPATAVGGFYGRALSPYLFPTDLFIETPKGFFNLSSWGTGYFWGQMRLTSATTYQLALWRNDNASSAASGSIYAIGRWK